MPAAAAGAASSSSSPKNNRRDTDTPSPDDSDDDRIILHNNRDNDSDNGKTCFTDEHLLLMDPTPPSSPENEKVNSEQSSTAFTAFASSRSSSMAYKITQKINSCLQTYASYMSTSLHQDRGLKLLQWSLWLASRLVLLKKQCKLQSSQQLQYISTCLRKLYLDVSFARYATRALSLPAAIAAAQSGSWGYQGSSTLTKYRRAHDVLGKLMAWSMIGYYPTELVAFVKWMLPAKPASSSGEHAAVYSRSAERWSYWSCRFWLAYLVAETCQCLLVYKELKDREAAQQRGEIDDDSDDKNAKAERQSLLRYTKLQLLRDALFFLPCLNWSLPNWDLDPMLPESVVNGLSWLESVVCLYQ
ncbi:hypothetical protein MPSEU_000977200 [Mayamaea pseudoterrestris]|nr:hypothetical protein MPSEU_000977200 [Mayamaea pseudoterrestris]